MTDVTFQDFWALFWPSITASLVAAGLSGMLGFFVVTRRVAFVSAALGQVSGLAVAFGFLAGSYFGLDPHEPTPVWLDPVVIAIVASGAVAMAMARVPRMQRTTPESTVAFVYLSAAALALIVLANPRIVQEAHEVGDLLFGSSVAVRREHLVELAVIAVVVIGSFIVLFKDLVFISFDPEMARTLGLPVTRLDLWMHLCIGVSVAVATRAIGALPVFGFIVLPAGAALLITESVVGVVLLSIVGALFAAAAGFYVSFVESWPTGPMMVVAAALFWPLAALIRLFTRARTA
ncbi:MAG: metal ABC transporter permease [Myxococcaceae bacterium]